jgi:hypothetical protein
MVVARRARRSGTRRHEGVEQRAAQGVVMSGGARGPLYRVGARERRRSGWELGRRLLMAPFRVGEEMGEGETEGEGRGWGGSTVSGGVEGRERRAGGWR